MIDLLTGIQTGEGCGYRGIARHEVKKVEWNCPAGQGKVEHTFVLVLYGAFDAYGLIGPECNGIAVLSVDDGQVVLDEHYKETTGYFGPSERQKEEFDRLMGLGAEEFIRFCRTHPRTRDDFKD